MTVFKRCDSLSTDAFFLPFHLAGEQEKSKEVAHGGGKRCHAAQTVINLPKIPRLTRV